MKVPLKFKYANQQAKEIYENNGGLKYESAGAAGFDLRACEFDLSSIPGVYSMAC